MKSFRTIVATSAALMALTALSAPTAQADTKSLADSIMRMDYRTFSHYKATRAPRPFNWRSDGCSSPVPLLYQFDIPCQQHDFGYRNYGNGLRLGRDGNTRAWIDRRFHEETRRLCFHRFSYNDLSWCLGQAWIMYVAVRNRGSSYFYG